MRNLARFVHCAFLRLGSSAALALGGVMVLLVVAILMSVASASLPTLDSLRVERSASTNGFAGITWLRQRLADSLQDTRATGAIVFRDQFRGGSPNLQWKPYPHFNLDSLRGAQDATSLGEEPGVGVLTNGNVGGFAALSYVEREVPADFALETWLRTAVTSGEKGQLNGIAFRVDPAGQRFYRVASEFASKPTLSLAYIGPNNFPVYLRIWHSDEIPGGAPAATSWHRLRIEVTGGRAEVYWDGVALPGGPFALDRSDRGFVGAYANFVGGLGEAETRVDDFTVWGPSEAPDQTELTS